MSLKNNIAVIIPAAGNSSRFGGSIPKQFLSLGEETVLEKSVNFFLEISSIKEVIVAINPNEHLIKSQSFYNDARVRFVEGGSTRSESVLNALEEVDQSIEIIVIHDAARPWLRRSHFEDLLHQLTNDQSAAGIFPVIPATDSLRMKKGEDLIPVEREQFLHVQTPQIFYCDSLKEAFNKLKKEDLHMSDESQVMEHAGFKLLAVPGERSNIKITYTDDIANYAGRDFRIGRGIDFHQFQPGDGLTLGNVFIDCELSIVAHSDGDIILHAISDALLGAAGLRDIGYYFPDSDPKNKNLSNYATSYDPPKNVQSKQPSYAKMGINNDSLMEKINYMIHLLEDQQHEKTDNITEEFLLYTFLGVFVIFVVDSFARAGKYTR